MIQVYSLGKFKESTIHLLASFFHSGCLSCSRGRDTFGVRHRKHMNNYRGLLAHPWRLIYRSGYLWKGGGKNRWGTNQGARGGGWRTRNGQKEPDWWGWKGGILGLVEWQECMWSRCGAVTNLPDDVLSAEDPCRYPRAAVYQKKRKRSCSLELLLKSENCQGSLMLESIPQHLEKPELPKTSSWEKASLHRHTWLQHWPSAVDHPPAPLSHPPKVRRLTQSSNPLITWQ